MNYVAIGNISHLFQYKYDKWDTKMSTSLNSYIIRVQCRGCIVRLESINFLWPNFSKSCPYFFHFLLIINALGYSLFLQTIMHSIISVTQKDTKRAMFVTRLLNRTYLLCSSNTLSRLFHLWFLHSFRKLCGCLTRYGG